MLETNLWSFSASSSGLLMWTAQLDHLCVRHVLAFFAGSIRPTGSNLSVFRRYNLRRLSSRALFFSVLSCRSRVPWTVRKRKCRSKVDGKIWRAMWKKVGQRITSLQNISGRQIWKKMLAGRRIQALPQIVWCFEETLLQIVFRENADESGKQRKEHDTSSNSGTIRWL